MTVVRKIHGDVNVSSSLFPTSSLSPLELRTILTLVGAASRAFGIPRSFDNFFHETSNSANRYQGRLGKRSQGMAIEQRVLEQVADRVGLYRDSEEFRFVDVWETDFTIERGRGGSRGIRQRRRCLKYISWTRCSGLRLPPSPQNCSNEKLWFLARRLRTRLILPCKQGKDS